MTITRRRLETYYKDRDNFIIIRTKEGYNITNLRTNKLYRITKTSGQIECSCPDWVNRGKVKNEACKHIFALWQNEQRKKKEKVEKLIERW